MSTCYPGYRKLAVCVKDSFGIPLVSIMVAIVYLVRDWRYLQLTVGFIGAFSLITWFFTHESVRWLAQNERRAEAKENLLVIARRNGRKLDAKQVEEIGAILDEIAAEHEGDESKKLSPLHMFKRQYIGTTAILVIGWICTNIGYYR